MFGNVNIFTIFVSILKQQLMKKTKTPTGYVIYKGPSQLNGKEIVAIVTMKSTNIKTGNMAQLWILLEGLNPVEASQTKADDAICGSCQFRQSLGGACYVNIGQAPGIIFRAYNKGNYPFAHDYSVFEGKSMRFGAYGDPAAIPLDILTKLKAVVTNNTSYTHQWKNNDNKALKDVSMASVDNLLEAEQAKERGYRWFRVTNDIETLRSDEIICPNYTSNVQCKDCKLCSGNGAKGAKSIVIPSHGSWKGRFTEVTSHA